MVRECTYQLELAVVSLPVGAVAYGRVTDPLVLDWLMLVTSSGHQLAAAVPTTLVESHERLEIDTTAGRAARHIVGSGTDPQRA